MTLALLAPMQDDDVISEIFPRELKNPSTTLPSCQLNTHITYASQQLNSQH